MLRRKYRAEKYITFPVPIKKKLDNDKIITYKLKSVRRKLKKYVISLGSKITDYAIDYDRLCNICKKNDRHQLVG